MKFIFKKLSIASFALILKYVHYGAGMSGFSLNQKDRILQKEYLYCLEKDWRGFFVLHGERKGVMSRDSIPVWNHSHKPIAHLWCAFKKSTSLLSLHVCLRVPYQQWQHSCLTLTLLSTQKSIRSSKIYLNLPNHSCFMYLIIKTFSIISCVSVPWSHKRKTVPCRCAKIKVCLNQSKTFQIVLSFFTIFLCSSKCWVN